MISFEGRKDSHSLDYEIVALELNSDWVDSVSYAEDWIYGCSVMVGLSFLCVNCT